MYTHLGLPNSHEYIAAMELEMWKLSQEEIFTDRMKAKEAEYLHKLGKVWQKREEERQKILTEKVRRIKCNIRTKNTMHTTNFSTHGTLGLWLLNRDKTRARLTECHGLGLGGGRCSPSPSMYQAHTAAVNQLPVP